jgi:hypothetical protein
MYGLEGIFGTVEPLVRVVASTVISYPLRNYILRLLAMRSVKGATKHFKSHSFKKKVLIQLDMYYGRDKKAAIKAKRAEEGAEKKKQRQLNKRYKKLKDL